MQKVPATFGTEGSGETTRHEKTLENNDSPAFQLLNKYTREDSNSAEKPRGSERNDGGSARGSALAQDWLSLREIIAQSSGFSDRQKAELIRYAEWLLDDQR